MSTRNFDSSTFHTWFTAYTLDSPEKQAVVERRLRHDFRVAFDARIATDPLHNLRAAPGPQLQPQYSWSTGPRSADVVRRRRNPRS